MRGTRACIPPRAGIPAWPSRRGTGALRPPRASGASPLRWRPMPNRFGQLGHEGGPHGGRGVSEPRGDLLIGERTRGGPAIGYQGSIGAAKRRAVQMHGIVERAIVVEKYRAAHGPLAFDLPQKVDHLDGRRGAVESFVARLGARTLDCLLDVLGCNDTEQYRNLCLQ